MVLVTASRCDLVVNDGIKLWIILEAGRSKTRNCYCLHDMVLKSIG